MSRKLGYPEPGAWVWDTLKGMPKIHPPDPLPQGLLSLEELRELIAYEGLGHCLFSIPAEKITDKELRILWQNAQDDSSAILNRLEASSFLQKKPPGAKKKFVKKPVKKFTKKKRPKAHSFGHVVSDS